MTGVQTCALPILFVGVKGFTVENSDKWGRQMFGLSLVVLLVWSIFVSI